jgi:hypothetical protein
MEKLDLNVLSNYTIEAIRTSIQDESIVYVPKSHGRVGVYSTRELNPNEIEKARQSVRISNNGELYLLIFIYIAKTDSSIVFSPKFETHRLKPNSDGLYNWQPHYSNELEWEIFNAVPVPLLTYCFAKAREIPPLSAPKTVDEE